MKNKHFKLTAFLVLTLTLSACDQYYDPGYNSPPPPYYGGGYNDGGYYERREAERARNERYRLERERERLENERERYEKQQNQPVYNPPPAYRPPPRQPDCPSGFYKGSKCSQDERRRGCKDLRGPNGDSCRSM